MTSHLHTQVHRRTHIHIPMHAQAHMLCTPFLSSFIPLPQHILAGRNSQVLDSNFLVSKKPRPRGERIWPWIPQQSQADKDQSLRLPSRLCGPTLHLLPDLCPFPNSDCLSSQWKLPDASLSPWGSPTLLQGSAKVLHSPVHPGDLTSPPSSLHTTWPAAGGMDRGRSGQRLTRPCPPTWMPVGQVECKVKVPQPGNSTSPWPCFAAPHHLSGRGSALDCRLQLGRPGRSSEHHSRSRGSELRGSLHPLCSALRRVGKPVLRGLVPGGVKALNVTILTGDPEGLRTLHPHSPG